MRTKCPRSAMLRRSCEAWHRGRYRNVTTESVLRDWRFGQTQAERLCAGILSIEGFHAVDPQHPLGGPDGIKDVICRRGLTRFVAAAYFPSTPSSFTEVKKKFRNDLLGPTANAVNGFIFVVNQHLTIGERTELVRLTDGVVEVAEIYHLERLRAVLDSPTGCGLRLEYLQIPMSHEEQIAYWSSANIDVAGRLDRIEQLQQRTLHRLEAGNEALLSRTTAMHLDLKRGPSSTVIAVANAPLAGPAAPATSNIDVPQLLWLHRVVVAEDQHIPSAIAGVLRTINVTIESGAAGTPVFVPPEPENLPTLLGDWCADWRNRYSDLSLQDSDTKLDGICRAYYGFLSIHPFTDGNGRIGRVLLDQMLREFLGRTLAPSFASARLELQEALTAANLGDLAQLRKVVETVLL